MASLSDQTMIDMFVNVFEGEAHYNKQEYDEAISYFKKILATAEKYGDEDSKMYAYQVLGKAYYFKNEYADSIFYGKKCLAMAEHFGDKKNQTEACVTLGAAHLKKQEYDDAIDYGKKGLTMAQECGDKHDEMETCMTLGLAHSKKNEYDDAIFYLQNFLAMAQQSGNKEDEVIAYIEIGTVHSKKQEYDDAISYGEKGLTIAKECGDKENEMKAYAFLRDARLGKEYDDAIRYSKKCLAMAQQSGSKEDEMDAYVKLGHALMMKQDYDNAILYCEKCLSLAQECGDKKSGMAACKILSNAHLNKQEYDDCISYERKFLSLAKDSGDKKDLMAETYITLGSVYLEKGEYDDAINCSKEGLAMAQKCGDKASETLAYKSLGRAHSERKEDDDAIFYTKKFLAMAQECGDKDDEMKAYKSLGNLFWNKEEYDEAISFYKDCLSIAQQSNDKVAEMKTSLLIGKTHLTKEEYEEAILCGRECLTIAQERGDKEEEMDAYSLIGTAHWKNNAYDDAYSYFTEGKKIAMNLKDDSRTSTFQSYLSMTYEEVGIETSGIFDTDISYAINFKRFNEHEIKWVFSYSYYVLHKQKDEYKQAISRLKEAEATLPTTQPKNDSIECRKKRWLCKQGIAEMNVKLGQHNEAMKYQQEALDVAVTRSHQAASHFGLGKLYYSKPDRELDSAMKSLDESLKCYELIFQDLKQNDRFKIFFVDKYQEVYKMLLKVLIETNKKEEALVLSDRYRAKALKDLLVSSYGMKKDPTAEETDYLQYADVQTLVSCRSYSLLFYSCCDEKLCTFLVQAGNALEFSVQHFEYCDKSLDKLVNKAYDDMKVSQIVNCEDRSLDVKDDSEENKNPKEDELTRMLTRQKEERLTEQCRSVCGCRCLVEEDENAVNPESPSGLEILYNKLIYNIKCLFKKEEILIIPEGPLCKVPFAALQDPETGQYLSETKRIRMAPSMATLKFLQEAYPKEHTRAKEALVIGDPLVGQVMMTETDMKITQLAGAREEANHIGSILGVQPLLGADATKTAVIERLQEGASIVHIAAHGNLEKATILLAPAPELRENGKIPDEEDYMLTMADVQQAQVRAQLVVLSCCYTGRGEIKAEGVVGLCRAFLASGARAVMGSLWAVHDDATMEFMKTFYKYLKDGKSTSTSLHLTMNDMRKTPEYSEPMFWAPFFLMGDDVTVTF